MKNGQMIMKMKKILLCLSLSCPLLFLSGCWDRQEVNDLALILGAGIDKISKHDIELSVLVYIPKGQSSQQGMEGSSSSGGNPQTYVSSAQGTTIADAMSKLQQKLPRHIFWGHTEVIIFDEKTAKSGMKKHIDFIMRHPQLRERSEIFISKEKAKKILALLPPMERDLSTVLRELDALKMGLEITAKELAQMLLSHSDNVAIPWIKILPPEKGKAKNQTSAFIAGTAIFKHDKMIGRINDSVTRGVLWLRNEIKLAIITVKPHNAKGYISMNLLQANSTLIPKVEKGKWTITLKAESYNDVIQNTTNLDMSNPDVIKELEKQLKKELETKVNLALGHVQKNMKTDIFGFDDAFHRKYPIIWKRENKNWNEIFPNVAVTVDANMKIRRQGKNSVLSTVLSKGIIKK